MEIYLRWPEFIKNFKTRIHTKPTSNDEDGETNKRLQGEVKREIVLTGTSSMFYVATLKTLKGEYGNLLLLTHLK